METDLLKDLKQVQLDNKLHVWYKRIPRDNAISLRLVINGGSAHQRLDELGLAHFVEHLVFNFENEKNGAKQLVGEIEQSGGYINAITELGSTVFVAEISSDKLGCCLELVDSCISSPDLSEETINKERGVILNELANEDGNFWNTISRKVWGNCALSYSGIGTPETIKRIEKEQIEEFFRKYYVINKMTVICVGDIEFEPLRDLVTSKIKRLRCNDESREHYKCPEFRDGYLKISTSLAENSIVYGFRVPGYSHQSKEYYALWFIRDYLDKKLFNFVREEGLSYTAAVSYGVNNITGLLYFYVRYIRQGRRAVIKKFESCVNDLKNNLITPAVFNECKTELINQYLDYLKDRKELTNVYQHYAEVYENVQDIKNDIQELQALTAEYIQQTANKYFVKSRTYVVRNSFWKSALDILWPFFMFFILQDFFKMLINSRSPLASKISLLSTALLGGLVVWLILDRIKLLNLLGEMKKEIQEHAEPSK